jgi:signal transduction histidine kinase/CheY-like chemotaxis protein
VPVSDGLDRRDSFPADLRVTMPGSELAELMAARDWSSSLLGEPRTWSPALRSVVALCMNSRFAMMIMWGPELMMIYNDAYAPMLGHRHPSALGRPIAEVWSEEWPVLRGIVDEVLDTGQATYSEDFLLVTTRNGFLEEAYFTFSYSPLPEPDGRIGGLLDTVAETTSQVLASRRLAALQQLGQVHAARIGGADAVAAAVAEVLSGFRADLPFAAIYLTDEEKPDGQRQVGGYGLDGRALPPIGPLAEATRRTLAGEEGVTAVDVAADVADLVESGAWRIGDSPVRTALVVPLGLANADRPIGVAVLGTSPYLRLDGDYRSFVDLVARQVGSAVTDAQAYDAAQRRAEALAELDRARTEFFTGVSHELRTPLALISGPAEDALADTAEPLTQAQRERLELVRRNAGRMRRMVDTLLDFAALEAGRLVPELVAVDAGVLTRDIAASFAPAARRAGLAVEVDSPDVGPVRLDPDMWEKVLLNLLSNAVKFTPQGGIGVRLRREGDVLDLRVTDSGVGIPADEVPALFRRFHRVRGNAGRSHEGTGIGLALVAELTALHGGTVEVASEPGEGTTFTVRIPVEDAGAVAEPVHPRAVDRYRDEALQWSATPDAGPAPGSSAPFVLVADDNQDLRRYLARLLEPHYRVLAVADGQEALDAVRREIPDLVLADVMMPRLDGLGLLAALRADPDTATTPVVLLSARAGEEAAVDGLAAGADDYLAKPFSPPELLARVRTTIGLAQVRARLLQEQTAVALTLQRSILGPTRLPDGFAVRYEPASTTLEVGGDWYDVVGLDDGTIGVVVGDVVGRGLDAAAVMGQLRSAGRALLLQQHTPARVLETLDRFVALTPGARCSTVFCAVIDPAAGTISYSSAGHLPAILVEESGGHRLLGDALAVPLAVLDDLTRPEAVAPLPAGSTLMLYTDGLVERRDDDVDNGVDRAVAALTAARELPSDAVVELVANRLLMDDHDDDVAFLVYRHPG